MFGSTIWAAGVLVVIAAAVEAYDQKLAMLLVMVTLFALFIRHADQIVSILQSIAPGYKPPIPGGGNVQ